MKFIFKSVLFISLFFVGFNMYEQYKHDQKANSLSCSLAKMEQTTVMFNSSSLRKMNADYRVDRACN